MHAQFAIHLELISMSNCGKVSNWQHRMSQSYCLCLLPLLKVCIVNGSARVHPFPKLHKQQSKCSNPCVPLGVIFQIIIHTAVLCLLVFLTVIISLYICNCQKHTYIPTPTIPQTEQIYIIGQHQQQQNNEIQGERLISEIIYPSVILCDNKNDIKG